MVDSCCDDIDTYVSIPGKEEIKMGFIIDAVLVFVIIAIMKIHGEFVGSPPGEFPYILIAVVIIVILFDIAVQSLLSLLGCD